MHSPATLYFNGKIYTMDRELPQVQALLIRDDRIEALGPDHFVELETDAETRRVDLDGQTVVPGFNDSHCHILSFGLTLDQVDLSAGTVRSLEDITRKVAERAGSSREDAWVIGRGYDQNAIHERRHPTRQDLDAVSGGHPVVLWHASSHALTCNSRALALAGVTATTATPPGGDIERDEHGVPTGLLKETPAMNLIGALIPAPSVLEGATAIRRAMEMMARDGITSASDAATGEGTSMDSALRMYAGALASGQLSGRITLMPEIRYVASPGSHGTLGPDQFRVGHDPSRLAIGPVKIFSDGALTTRTAALRQPYFDDGHNTGLLIWNRETLDDMIRRVHEAGWQIATHAIGDRAVETVVDCYDRALAAVPRDDHRHRIEHCMLLDSTLVQRMRRLGIVPVVQPGFIQQFGDAYIAALGEERASELMPMELFDLIGLQAAFSSDRPVIPGTPLAGIKSAIQRVAPSGAVLGARHRISALQAIRCYTASSAYATFTESRKGTLRRGALADFTVLSRDPADTPLEEWDDIAVTMTVVGGNPIYQAH